LNTREQYELYAIRYAHNPHRRRNHSFIFSGAQDAFDPHDAPMPMDYFVWAAIGETRSFVIDMGFTRQTAEKRKHAYLRCPSEGLELIGLDAASVEDLIITHMHWDHAGNFETFPKARFHIQEREMRYITGRDVHWKGFKPGVSVEDTCHLIRNVYKDRVVFHDGAAELAPGFSVHYVGGHTRGHQIAQVHTARGWVVVASDAAHFYANMEARNPFPAVYHVGENLASFDIARELGESADHVIPGHDPLVMARYPAPSPELEGIIARLDTAPR
jgi:glyoxylase-like metal-dependent hydrolase (beta-lactamase superfamily II)